MQNTEKQTLRKSLLGKRKALTPQVVVEHGRRIQSAIAELPSFMAAREVLAYLPIQNEVRTQRLLEHLFGRETRVLLPRCRPEEKGVMDVACITCFDEVVAGSYGILEPHPDECHALVEYSPDVVIIPGVGYDLSGNRLGFGGGYYDRILADERLQNACVIAPAYSFQVVDSVPSEDWDRPVNLIVTEKDILEVHPC